MDATLTLARVGVGRSTFIAVAEGGGGRSLSSAHSPRFEMELCINGQKILIFSNQGLRSYSVLSLHKFISHPTFLIDPLEKSYRRFIARYITL